MKRIWWPPLFVLLSVVMASAQQHPHPPDVGPCKVIDREFGPTSCPNGSGCGSYYTFVTEDCNIDNEEYCDQLVPISTCCAKYGNYEDGGVPCLLVEMRDPRFRVRILELALENEILVPTCNGAYVPARTAFREHKQKDKDNGGM